MSGVLEWVLTPRERTTRPFTHFAVGSSSLRLRLTMFWVKYVVETTTIQSLHAVSVVLTIQRLWSTAIAAVRGFVTVRKTPLAAT